MCPATLLPEPMTCDAAGLRDLTRASAAAGFPTFSLWSFYATGNGVDTARMMFDDAGVSVRAVEAATRWTEGPEAAVADADLQLDVASVFGADLLLACTMAPTMDAARATEGFAALCERASKHGVRVAIEFLPWSAVPDLATAWRLVQESGAANGGIVIDMLHWQRQPGGPNLELLRQIPGDRIPYVQVCDAAPGPSGTHDYLTEALTARPRPGRAASTSRHCSASWPRSTPTRTSRSRCSTQSSPHAGRRRWPPSCAGPLAPCSTERVRHRAGQPSRSSTS